MLRRAFNLLRYRLERLVLRGPLFRLLVVAVLIALISLGAGVLVFCLGAPFRDSSEAIWWAFLRMTDPGYLGDDQGPFLRFVSTLVTLSGYVLFLGALVAIMTQWFNHTMDRLQAGFTPIARNHHMVLLGASRRTALVLQELFVSRGRVRSFLQRRGRPARALHVAILSERSPADLVAELSAHLGAHWDPHSVTLRSGEPLQLDHLRRVDFLHAAAVLLPSPETTPGLSPTSSDAETMKILLTVSEAASSVPAAERPFLVAEITDPRKAALARKLYDGPCEIISSSRIISRLIVQNVRYPGITSVYTQLLGHLLGSELYVKEADAWVGRTFGDVRRAFSAAIPIGLVRRRDANLEPRLAPLDSDPIHSGDRLVVVARGEEQLSEVTAPRPVAQLSCTPRRQHHARATSQRVLILGWNHKVPTVLEEFDQYSAGSFQVDVLALVPPPERHRLLARQGVQLERLQLRDFEGDLASHADLQQVTPATYDHIVLMASDWLETDAESDARTTLGYLVLRDVLQAAGAAVPSITIELLHEENALLFRGTNVALLHSSVLASHLVTHVALRRELGGVFAELAGPTGTELCLARLDEYGLTPSPLTFRELGDALASVGDALIGLRLRTGHACYDALNVHADSAVVWDDVVALIVVARPEPCRT